MSHAEVQSKLAALRAQLAAAEGMDASQRASLLDTIAQVEAALDSSEQTPSKSLSGRVNDAVQHFEESHPGLARSLEGLIEALAQIGI